MAQFDVYAVRQDPARYVVQIQANLLETLTTRIVVPLLPLSPHIQVSRLHPVISILGQDHILAPNLTASIKASVLKVLVLSLAHSHRQTIIDAMDFLLLGA